MTWHRIKTNKTMKWAFSCCWHFCATSKGRQETLKLFYSKWRLHAWATFENSLMRCKQTSKDPFFDWVPDLGTFMINSAYVASRKCILPLKLHKRGNILSTGVANSQNFSPPAGFYSEVSRLEIQITFLVTKFRESSFYLHNAKFLNFSWICACGCKQNFGKNVVLI